MTDIRDDVKRGFHDRFGHHSTGVWSAPGRVNLIGEHTDYNEGFVFPFAIDRRTVVAVRLRNDRVVRVSSSFSDEIVAIDLPSLRPDGMRSWSAYPLGVAWALGQFGADLDAVNGFDLSIDSDVPVGAGLSSSAAIESAVALALNDVWQLGLDRGTLVHVGQLAENRVVGAPTGIMDQSAALLGERDSGVFLDCRSEKSEIIPLGFAEAGLDVVVVDTKVSHSHSTGGYAARRASCEAGAAALGVPSLRDVHASDLASAREVLGAETFKRVTHVVTENQRVLDFVRTLREKGPAHVGAILDAGHRSLRDNFEVSVSELDLAVETAQANGALGARMTGGGFGGAAIALVPTHLVSLVHVALNGAFAEHGFTQPDTFVVSASSGATRDE